MHEYIEEIIEEIIEELIEGVIEEIREKENPREPGKGGESSAGPLDKYKPLVKVDKSHNCSTT